MLPPGLRLTHGGVISGRPTVAGTFRFTVRVRNRIPRPRTATRTFTITVRPVTPPVVTPPAPPAVGQIAFQSQRHFAYEIYVVNADGTNVRSVSKWYCFISENTPAWSPDGTRIAFVSYRDRNFEIYVMNADGTNLRRLTNHPAEDRNPVWSPVR